MTVIQFKRLASAIALATATVMMGCAQTGGGTSGNSGPYGSAAPGQTTIEDPNLSALCQNAPAIERDACMARAKERRSSPVKGS